MTVEAKEVTLTTAGANGRKSERVRLLPGVSARDVLSRMGLNQGYQLNKPSGGAFRPADDVYGAVKQNDTIFASRNNVDAGVAA